MGLKKPKAPKGPYVAVSYTHLPDPKLKCFCGKLLSEEDRCPLPQGKVCPNLQK